MRDDTIMSPENRDIRIMTHLILGLGTIGKQHARLLLEAQQRVLGVDPLPQKDWQATFPLFTTVQEIPVEEFDVVWVCTPTHLHVEQAQWALSLGKHVFIEKPSAVSYEEGRRLLAIHREMKKRPMIWIGCNMRFHPAVMGLKKAVDSDMIGRPLIYRSHLSHYLPEIWLGIDYRETHAVKQQDGGGIILYDIHDIDLAQWFNGPARKIRALATHSGFLEMNVEDMACIIMLHDDGALSELHMDFLRKDKSRGIEIIGEYGSLEWRSKGNNPEHIQVVYYPDEGEQSILLEQNLEPDSMFRSQLSLILKELSDEPPYFSNLADAVRALEIASIARREYDSLC